MQHDHKVPLHPLVEPQCAVGRVCAALELVALGSTTELVTAALLDTSDGAGSLGLAESLWWVVVGRLGRRVGTALCGYLRPVVSSYDVFRETVYYSVKKHGRTK